MRLYAETIITYVKSLGNDPSGEAHTRDGGQRLMLLRALCRKHGWERSMRKVSPRFARHLRAAFDRGDTYAGYVLADHYERTTSPELHGMIVELYERVPDDTARDRGRAIASCAR